MTKMTPNIIGKAISSVFGILGAVVGPAKDKINRDHHNEFTMYEEQWLLRMKIVFKRCFLFKSK